jgi:hypothetical protein
MVGAIETLLTIKISMKALGKWGKTKGEQRPTSILYQQYTQAISEQK